MRSKATATVAAALLLASGGSGAGVANADPPAPPPAPKTTIDHDGTFQVGTDIVPGTYTSAGPAGSGTCYWKRAGGADGTETIDNAISKKPQAVQIDATDKSFKTDGCQPWQKTDDASPAGGVPGLLAQAQLRADMDNINARARQFDGSQVPPP
ncbi:MAG: hypothetical protein JO152_14370 [Mycobacteriaceae bacterium]|nr:hypothetical protein [Mycobacteriaceae bacterium]